MTHRLAHLFGAEPENKSSDNREEPEYKSRLAHLFGAPSEGTPKEPQPAEEPRPVRRGPDERTVNVIQAAKQGRDEPVQETPSEPPKAPAKKKHRRVVSTFEDLGDELLASEGSPVEDTDGADDDDDLTRFAAPEKEKKPAVDDSPKAPSAEKAPEPKTPESNSAPSPLAFGDNGTWLAAVSPSGEFAYLVNDEKVEVLRYTDSGTGAVVHDRVPVTNILNVSCNRRSVSLIRQEGCVVFEMDRGTHSHILLKSDDSTETSSEGTTETVVETEEEEEPAVEEEEEIEVEKEEEEEPVVEKDPDRMIDFPERILKFKYKPSKSWIETDGVVMRHWTHDFVKRVTEKGDRLSHDMMMLGVLCHSTVVEPAIEPNPFKLDELYDWLKLRLSDTMGDVPTETDDLHKWMKSYVDNDVNNVSEIILAIADSTSDLRMVPINSYDEVLYALMYLGPVVLTRVDNYGETQILHRIGGARKLKDAHVSLYHAAADEADLLAEDVPLEKEDSPSLRLMLCGDLGESRLMDGVEAYCVTSSSNSHLP